MTSTTLTRTATSGRSLACADAFIVEPSGSVYAQPMNWHGKRGADLATSPGRSHARTSA